MRRERSSASEFSTPSSTVEPPIRADSRSWRLCTARRSMGASETTLKKHDEQMLALSVQWRRK